MNQVNSNQIWFETRSIGLDDGLLSTRGYNIRALCSRATSERQSARRITRREHLGRSFLLRINLWPRKRGGDCLCSRPPWFGSDVFTICAYCLPSRNERCQFSSAPESTLEGEDNICPFFFARDALDRFHGHSWRNCIVKKHLGA